VNAEGKSGSLADIMYGTNPKSARNPGKPKYVKDELDQPKHKITNPQLFAKTREVLGNLISRRMKASGGTDIDWLIEHNGGFMIFELKIFHDDKIVVSKAQMSAYEKLYENLPKCRVLFIGHDDIAFMNLEDPVWIFEMRDWKAGIIPRIEDHPNDSDYNENISGYRVERDFMERMDIKILREKIDQIWD